MRNKKLWKNLMLVTTLTVALGTVSATALAEDDVTLAGGTQVTAFASEGDIDGGIAVETQAEQTAPEAEQTTPEADTTDAEATVPEATAPEVEVVPEAEQTAPEAIAPEQTAPEATVPEADIVPETEVSAPEVKAVTVDVTSSSTTFDGTQDIVITYTVNGVQDGFEPYQDIPWFDGKTGVKEEKVSSTVYKFTIPTTLQQYVIEQNGATDGQTFVFDSKYSTGAVDFPTVTLTYTTGDNGDNGNGETPEKPENPDPDNGNGDNGNGETPEKPENPDPDNGNGDNNNGGDNGNGETPEKPENPDPENPDNGNGETPENPDNGNGDNQKPENPDNGGDNGDNQNPDGDNNQTPETPDNGDDNKDVQDWMTLTPAQKVTTTTQTQTPQTQTVSTTQTAPKTGDAASTLPLLGTGLTSLGVALGAIFKKRR